MVSIRTLVLEYMDREGAAYIRELHIEILRDEAWNARAHNSRPVVGGGG